MSMRLRADTQERLRERARVLDEPYTRLAERFIEERLRMGEHPGIYFREAPAGTRAAVLGTGLDVWEVVMVFKDNDESIEETAAYLEKPEAFIEDAIGYYRSYQDEIDTWLEEMARYNRQAEAEWRAAREAVRE